MISTNTSTKARPLQNVQFCSRSRKTKILTAGIPGVFRGLKSESDADSAVVAADFAIVAQATTAEKATMAKSAIGQKGMFCKGLTGWAAWFTGLPGSGKSKLSKLVCELLNSEGVTCERIELDTIRKEYVPNPKYTDAERDFVYEKLADRAAERIQSGVNIIIDGTAHKRSYRERARKKIDRFIEVMVRCPLDVCIERESKREGGLVAAQMYRRALERKEKGTQFKDLGQVIGVDIPYEENPDAEIVVDSSRGFALENARIVKDALLRYLNH